ncbi:hypothetical protein [Mycobacterium avium]|uniref:hypothetical protein n=1 Tax=Mycobacterium avium TaxID=1764 RepID=UPI000BAEADD4|nr:hypothetical protein [Mycobacterium avium]MDO2394741.1 hypothetical protein [Mycobacterium avium subsp. hominissuis]PBA73148.1 hypothetical protein CKJ76_03520 [Mycobacterium avium]
MHSGDEGFEATVERTAAAERAFEAVSRLVVVKGDVRREYWADSWHVSVQDGGRTVKFFAVGDADGAVADRAAALGDMLGVSAPAAQDFAQEVAEAEGQPDRFGRSGRH